MLAAGRPVRRRARLVGTDAPRAGARGPGRGRGAPSIRADGRRLHRSAAGRVAPERADRPRVPPRASPPARRPASAGSARTTSINRSSFFSSSSIRFSSSALGFRRRERGLAVEVAAALARRSSPPRTPVAARASGRCLRRPSHAPRSASPSGRLDADARDDEAVVGQDRVIGRGVGPHRDLLVIDGEHARGRPLGEAADQPDPAPVGGREQTPGVLDQVQDGIPAGVGETPGYHHLAQDVVTLAVVAPSRRRRRGRSPSGP